MTEEIKLNPGSSDEETYKNLLPQIASIIVPEEPIISSLSNITAVLKSAFPKISWVGFYFIKNNKLFLGPFQGKIACTVLTVGRGVCGTCVENKATIIVEDVDLFPGHVACDAETKSEIVIPITHAGQIIGVLDLDSHHNSSFTEIDKKYLEELCKLVTQKLDFNNFTLN